jgi:hypothetical protein
MYSRRPISKPKTTSPTPRQAAMNCARAIVNSSNSVELPISNEVPREEGRRQAVKAEFGDRDGELIGKDREDSGLDPQLLLNIMSLGEAKDPGAVHVEGRTVVALAQVGHLRRPSSGNCASIIALA